MPKAVTEKFTYRQSGYECPTCGDITMTFGDAPAPTNCEGCAVEVTFKKTWDHVVTTHTVVNPIV